MHRLKKYLKWQGWSQGFPKMGALVKKILGLRVDLVFFVIDSMKGCFQDGCISVGANAPAAPVLPSPLNDIYVPSYWLSNLTITVLFTSVLARPSVWGKIGILWGSISCTLRVLPRSWLHCKGSLELSNKIVNILQAKGLVNLWAVIVQKNSIASLWSADLGSNIVKYSLLSSVWAEPTFWRAEPSFLIRQAEPSRAFFRKGELSRAELFAFKTEPNRAFGFPKLSYFWLFSVDFFKEYNFLEEKTHFYWCLQDYTLKNWQKCWKSAHFLFFKVTRFFKW